jgi:hypothetical protein
MPTVRHARTCLGLFTIGVAVLALGMAEPDRRPAPLFQGTGLPEPPQQQQPWKPPTTNLSPTLLSATTALFDAGLADPRGCDYRAIEVGVGSVWGGSGIVKTHGWVLPADPKEKQRFAVCWNGLVYPVISVGDPADLKADVLAVVMADEERRAAHAKERPDWPFTRFHVGHFERDAVAHEGIKPLMVCLLLRLRESELAAKVWTAWIAEKPDEADPYLMLAGHWAWALFERAVGAHIRGDDPLALASVRPLTAIQKAVESEAEKRGIERPYSFRRDPKPAPYLNFLDPLPALLADQERRAKTAERCKERRAELQKTTDKAKRIALLIEELEEVAARQWGQPGGVNLADDPIVQALVDIGDDAVEPLLNCLENDNRLTRSVHFHRDFSRHRSILGVHEAAYVALANILQTSFFGVAATGDNLTSRGGKGRKQTADNIRAYWQRFKGVPLEERWYRLLADDKAPSGHWLQAAASIVQPANAQNVRGSMVFATWIETPGKPAKLRGEVLRKKTDPSVGELLKKRLRELAARDDRSMSDLSELAHNLGAWEGKAALNDLRWFCGLVEQHTIAKGNEYGGLIYRLCKLYDKRRELGDKNLLTDYAAWITGMKFENSKDGIPQMFELMYTHPDDPEIIKAAEQMFGRPDSPWVPLLSPGHGYHTHRLLEMPMLGVPAFRKMILAALNDKSRAGTVTILEGGQTKVETTVVWSNGAFADKFDPLTPKPGTRVAFRVCDHYAAAIAGSGLPRCRLYWPEAKRDEAVARCAARLRQYGDRFKPDENVKLPAAFAFKHRVMIFPLLDRPATADDVKSGRAIFALPPEEKPRLWKLPSRPLAATWVTLKDYPYEQSWSSTSGERGTDLVYDRDGLVWQAEEIERGGKVQRYFGFVGSHVIARVPAEEIEFPGEAPWGHLSRGLDGQVSTPGTVVKDGTTTFAKLAVGDKLPVTLTLRNRKAVEQSVPGVYLQKVGDKPSLHPGIDFRLWHAPLKVSPLGQPIRPFLHDSDWRELKPKTALRFKPGERTKVLAPLEELTAFEVDLTDLFEITDEGFYFFEMSFKAKEAGLADGKLFSNEFQLGKRPQGEGVK